MNEGEFAKEKEEIIDFFDRLGEEDYWKTLDEISRETGINSATASKIINLSGDFVRSSYRRKAGEPLFTSRRSFRAKAPFVDKIIGAFKNRID
jgi:hypothetical protein